MESFWNGKGEKRLGSRLTFLFLIVLRGVHSGIIYEVQENINVEKQKHTQLQLRTLCDASTLSILFTTAGGEIRLNIGNFL